MSSQKERDVESQYDYFGARYYDSRIGRWLAVDPRATKYPGISPFSFCAGNPICYTDIDGREIKPRGEMVAMHNELMRTSPIYAEKVRQINEKLGSIDVPFGSKGLDQIYKESPPDVAGKPELGYMKPGEGKNKECQAEGSEAWVAELADINNHPKLKGKDDQVLAAAEEIMHLGQLVIDPKKYQEEREKEKKEHILYEKRHMENEAKWFAKMVAVERERALRREQEERQNKEQEKK